MQIFVFDKHPVQDVYQIKIYTMNNNLQQLAEHYNK